MRTVPMSALQGYRSWPFCVSEFFCTDHKNFLLWENTRCGSGGSVLSAVALPLLCISRIGEKEEPEMEELRKKCMADLVSAFLPNSCVLQSW